MIFWLLFSWNIHSKEIRKIFDLLSIQLSLGIFSVRRMGETSRISSPFFFSFMDLVIFDARCKHKNLYGDYSPFSLITNGRSSIL